MLRENPANFYERQTGKDWSELPKPQDEALGDYGMAGTKTLDALKEFREFPDQAYRDVVESNWQKRARWERLGLNKRNLVRIGAVAGGLALAASVGSIVAPSVMAGAADVFNDYVLKPVVKPVAEFIASQVKQGADLVGDKVIQPVRDKVADVGLFETKETVAEVAPKKSLANKLGIGHLQEKVTGIDYTEPIVPIKETVIENMPVLGSASAKVVEGGPIFKLAKEIVPKLGAKDTETRAIQLTKTLGNIFTPFFGSKYLGGATEYANAGKLKGVTMGGAGAAAFFLLKPFRRIGDSYRVMFPKRSAAPLRIAEDREMREKMDMVDEDQKVRLKLARKGLEQREHWLVDTAQNLTFENA